jgi:hypothetical protein
MEIVSSRISDFWLFVRRQNLFPGVKVLENYNSLGMGLQFFVPLINFGDFLRVAVKSVILAKFVQTITSITMVICILDSRQLGCLVVTLRITRVGTFTDID